MKVEIMSIAMDTYTMNIHRTVSRNGEKDGLSLVTPLGTGD